MDFSTSALSNRAMSAFPVSIGTSLALESIFSGTQAAYDPLRVIPENINIANYDCMWVNLMTLYRNIIGSLEKGDSERVMAGDLWETLEFEVSLIKSLVEETSFGKTKAVFYASKYDGLSRKHPHGILRKQTTEKQQSYNRLMELTINSFIKAQTASEHIRLFDLGIEPKVKQNGLILTHYAYDLLAYPLFEKLDLIESHTGVLKGRALWYTKFANSKELMRIPFNACFLQVFGDSQTFAPMPIKLREQVIALADQYNWHPLVTKDRLRFSFDTMADKFSAAVMKEMLSE